MNRVTLEQTSIAGIAALHAAPMDAFERPLPCVVLFHGFTRSKELDSNLAYMLARAGIRVVVPEADQHGTRFDGDESARLRRFWDILRRCIDELPLLRAHCEQHGLVDGQRFGVAGLSMGAFAVLGCLARYEWLRAGVSWMGAGRFLELSRALYPPLGSYAPATAAAHEGRMSALAEHDPALRLERLAGRPLLLWHGVRDEIVPFNESAWLYAELVRRDIAQGVKFIADPGATHKLPLSGAQAGVDFLQRSL